MAGKTSDIAAKRYSRAAFEIALEKGDLQGWQAALDQIASFMSNPEVASVMENTRVPQAAKLGVLDSVLGSLPELPKNLARLLIRKGRTAMAQNIAAQFTQLLRAQQGIAEATAKTAVPLDDNGRQVLTRQLREATGRDVILQTEVDPSILGGVVVQIGDRLIDASTKAKLQALRESMAGAL